MIVLQQQRRRLQDPSNTYHYIRYNFFKDLATLSKDIINKNQALFVLVDFNDTLEEGKKNTTIMENAGLVNIFRHFHSNKIPQQEHQVFRQ